MPDPIIPPADAKTRKKAEQDQALANAKGAAKKATDTRDAAAKALAGWIGEFRKVAKRTLRGRKDLLAALEL